MERIEGVKRIEEVKKWLNLRGIEVNSEFDNFILSLRDFVFSLRGRFENSRLMDSIIEDFVDSAIKFRKLLLFGRSDFDFDFSHFVSLISLIDVLILPVPEMEIEILEFN